MILGLLGIGGAAIGLVAAATSASSVNGGFGLLILVANGWAVRLWRLLRTPSAAEAIRWVRLNQVLLGDPGTCTDLPLVKYSFSTGGFYNRMASVSTGLLSEEAPSRQQCQREPLSPGPTAIGVNLFARHQLLPGTCNSVVMPNEPINRTPRHSSAGRNFIRAPSAGLPRRAGYRRR